MTLPFSSQTREALNAAEAEAAAAGSPTVESEHILLGLLADPDSPAARLLADEFGLTLGAAREGLVGHTPHEGDEANDGVLTLSADAQRIAQQAISEAQTLGADEVRPLHLLLGVLRRKHEVSGAALALLEAHAESIATITREVRAALRERDA